MSTAQRTNEQRAEQRLRYRWPIRFARELKQKPLIGQIVDVTSRGLAFLYHPGQHCPQPDQLITTSFGVPHFSSQGSFDTVLTNRVGRVCRVDSLSDRVNRIAIQFAEPLFFRPGEQNISDAEVKKRLEAAARFLVRGKRKAVAHDDTPAETASSATAESESTPQVRKPADSEDQAARKLRACAEQIAKVKAEAAQQIARVSAEAAEAIARIETELDAGASIRGRKRGARTRKKSRSEEQIAPPVPDRSLLDRIDSFFTDKSKVF